MNIKVTLITFLSIQLLVFPLTLALQLNGPTFSHLAAPSQLSTLMQQQLAFEQNINNLIKNVTNVQVSINASTTNVTQQINLLETAIANERMKISQLQKSISPQFNNTAPACQGLTVQQKANLALLVNSTKTQLSKLHSLAGLMPVNPMLTQINSDILQQLGVISSIQNIMHSKCNKSSLLQPTVFQSNLFASNWILGRQTITNLIDQYYQRSQLYKTVSNCPLATPFFNGTNCISCNGILNIFNMELGQCEKCPSGFALHLTNHTCQLVPHYTNFNLTHHNYILGGAKALPAAPAGVSSCPSTYPYWNTTNCVKCSLPEYWNVNTSRCMHCAPGLVFDKILKNCTLPQNNTLTFLFGNSRWITTPGNLTGILAARAKIANGNYTICSMATPYFDGIHCINCPYEFNLTSKKCVKAPAGYAFDPNLHTYVKVQNNITTNPNAAGYISSVPLNKAGNHCNSSHPYFDGIACIACPAPFPLFNISTKTCVQCAATKYYDNKTHMCVKRPIVFISAFFSNIMTTPNLTLSSYKAQLYNMVKNNNNSIIRACPPGQYSNQTHCFNCSKGLYFNIATKSCAKCNGTVDNVTFLCHHFVTRLTNLNASNLILPNGANLTTYQQLQKQVKGPVAACPSSAPYAVGYKCIACNGSSNSTNGSSNASSMYFNMSTQKCVHCPPNLFYDSVLRICNHAINVTNTSALVNYFGAGNHSIGNISAQLKALGMTRKVNICPSSAPLALKNGSCVACNGIYFVNLTSMTCVKGIRVSNFPVLAKSRVIQIGNATLASLKIQQYLLSKGIPQKPVVFCPTSKPLYNGRNCIACNSTQYYDLQGLFCYNPKNVSNVTALAISQKYVSLPNHTLLTIEAAINASVLPVNQCPSSKPLYNGSACVGCAPGLFYDLKNLSCYKPNLASNISALNSSGRAVSIGAYSLAALARNISNSVYPLNPCNSSAPLFNGSSCIACPSAQFYDIKSLKCISAIIVSNVAGLNATNKTVAIGQYTLAFTQSQIKALAVPIQVCPASKPLFNGSLCVSCPPGEYYLLQTLKCYKPLFSSNLSALNSSGRIIQVGNFTLKSLSAQAAAQPLPTKPCPAAAPLLSGGKCLGCPSPQYYDLQTGQCYSAKFASNVTELALSGKALPYANHTLASLNKSIMASPYPTVPCPRAAPLFNGSACTFCPPGTYYLLSNLTCYQPRLVSNVSALAATRKVLSFKGITLAMVAASINKSVLPLLQCPALYPLFNGTQCVACLNANYYLLSNFSCYVPQQVTNVSELASTHTFVNVGAKTLSALNTSISSSKIPYIVCPSNAPLFNGLRCIKCKPGQYYNLGSLKCQNPNIVSNVLALKLTNNYLVTSKYNMTTLQSYINKVPYPAKACPSSTPLFNGTICIVCTYTIYDIYNKKCVACASGYYYNSTQHLCVPTPVYYPNLNSTFWIVNNYTGLKQLINMTNQRKLIKGAKMCPITAPDFNLHTNTCQKCPAGQYWNYFNYTCMACPAGLSVDPNTRTCLKKLIGVYETNLAASNLLFNGLPKAEYQYIQTIDKLTYPGIKKCPQPTPYFDGYKCIACKAPFPLFSMLHKVCASCPVRTVYHPKMFNCLTIAGALVNSPPNLSKIYSSIF